MFNNFMVKGLETIQLFDVYRWSSFVKNKIRFQNGERRVYREWQQIG